ncbi:MAG: aminoacetone oxidase family FAD-binding enzyme, partial [Terriglobales bacterium]
LARYTPADFIALVEKHGIPYHEKTLGQLFCDRSARDILTMLESECRDAQVQILTDIQITELTHETEFVVRTAQANFRAPALVVATGGISIPKMGATGFGYDVARQFGLKIIQPRPALVPLVFNGEDKSAYCDLAGISADVVASLDGQHFREKMLITHRGLSGPAILQISSYWTAQQEPGKQPIQIDLAPQRDVAAPIQQTTVRNVTTTANALQEVLPARLANRWLELHAPNSWTNHDLTEWERGLHHWEITPAGTEGFEKAEVTAGGVDTDELSAKTLESKKVRGLYFIGEVVDVTGHLGGFNFQWAWASGAAAGRAL